jgi:hypothetical protein
MRIHYRNVAIADANSSAIIGGIIVAEASATNSSAVLIRKRCHASMNTEDSTKQQRFLLKCFFFPFFRFFRIFVLAMTGRLQRRCST